MNQPDVVNYHVCDSVQKFNITILNLMLNHKVIISDCSDGRAWMVLENHMSFTKFASFPHQTFLHYSDIMLYSKIKLYSYVDQKRQSTKYQIEYH